MIQIQQAPHPCVPQFANPFDLPRTCPHPPQQHEPELELCVLGYFTSGPHWNRLRHHLLLCVVLTDKPESPRRTRAADLWLLLKFCAKQCMTLHVNRKPIANAAMKAIPRRTKAVGLCGADLWLLLMLCVKPCVCVCDTVCVCHLKTHCKCNSSESNDKSIATLAGGFSKESRCCLQRGSQGSCSSATPELQLLLWSPGPLTPLSGPSLSPQWNRIRHHLLWAPLTLRTTSPQGSTAAGN